MGETFYVDRGIGNRWYSNIRDELWNDSDEVGDKLRRIREIRLAGFEVAHVVHRRGMEVGVAKEVEAALIDAYPGLTNAEAVRMVANEVQCMLMRSSVNILPNPRSLSIGHYCPQCCIKKMAKSG